VAQIISAAEAELHLLATANKIDPKPPLSLASILVSHERFLRVQGYSGDPMADPVYCPFLIVLCLHPAVNEIGIWGLLEDVWCNTSQARALAARHLETTMMRRALLAWIRALRRKQADMQRLFDLREQLMRELQSRVPLHPAVGVNTHLSRRRSTYGELSDLVDPWNVLWGTDPDENQFNLPGGENSLLRQPMESCHHPLGWLTLKRTRPDEPEPIQYPDSVPPLAVLRRRFAIVFTLRRLWERVEQRRERERQQRISRAKLVVAVEHWAKIHQTKVFRAFRDRVRALQNAYRDLEAIRNRLLLRYCFTRWQRSYEDAQADAQLEGYGNYLCVRNSIRVWKVVLRRQAQMSELLDRADHHYGEETKRRVLRSWKNMLHFHHRLRELALQPSAFQRIKAIQRWRHTLAVKRKDAELERKVLHFQCSKALEKWRTRTLQRRVTSRLTYNAISLRRLKTLKIWRARAVQLAKRRDLNRKAQAFWRKQLLAKWLEWANTRRKERELIEGLNHKLELQRRNRSLQAAFEALQHNANLRVAHRLVDPSYEVSFTETDSKALSKYAAARAEKIASFKRLSRQLVLRHALRKFVVSVQVLKEAARKDRIHEDIARLWRIACAFRVWQAKARAQHQERSHYESSCIVLDKLHKARTLAKWKRLLELGRSNRNFEDWKAKQETKRAIAWWYQYASSRRLRSAQLEIAERNKAKDCRLGQLMCRRVLRHWSRVARSSTRVSSRIRAFKLQHYVKPSVGVWKKVLPILELDHSDTLTEVEHDDSVAASFKRKAIRIRDNAKMLLLKECYAVWREKFKAALFVKIVTHHLVKYNLRHFFDIWKNANDETNKAVLRALFRKWRKRTRESVDRERELSLLERGYVMNTLARPAFLTWRERLAWATEMKRRAEHIAATRPDMRLKRDALYTWLFELGVRRRSRYLSLHRCLDIWITKTSIKSKLRHYLAQKQLIQISTAVEQWVEFTKRRLAKKESDEVMEAKIVQTRKRFALRAFFNACASSQEERTANTRLFAIGGVRITKSRLFAAFQQWRWALYQRVSARSKLERVQIILARDVPLRQAVQHWSKYTEARRAWKDRNAKLEARAQQRLIGPRNSELLQIAFWEWHSLVRASIFARRSAVLRVLTQLRRNVTLQARRREIDRLVHKMAEESALRQHLRIWQGALRYNIIAKNLVLQTSKCILLLYLRRWRSAATVASELIMFLKRKSERFPFSAAESDLEPPEPVFHATKSQSRVNKFSLPQDIETCVSDVYGQYEIRYIPEGHITPESIVRRWRALEVSDAFALWRTRTRLAKQRREEIRLFMDEVRHRRLRTGLAALLEAARVGGSVFTMKGKADVFARTQRLRRGLWTLADLLIARRIKQRGNQERVRKALLFWKLITVQQTTERVNTELATEHYFKALLRVAFAHWRGQYVRISALDLVSERLRSIRESQRMKAVFDAWYGLLQSNLRVRKADEELNARIRSFRLYRGLKGLLMWKTKAQELRDLSLRARQTRIALVLPKVFQAFKQVQERRVADQWFGAQTVIAAQKLRALRLRSALKNHWLRFIQAKRLYQQLSVHLQPNELQQTQRGNSSRTGLRGGATRVQSASSIAINSDMLLTERKSTRRPSHDEDGDDSEPLAGLETDDVQQAIPAQASLLKEVEMSARKDVKRLITTGYGIVLLRSRIRHWRRYAEARTRKNQLLSRGSAVQLFLIRKALLRWRKFTIRRCEAAGLGNLVQEYVQRNLARRALWRWVDAFSVLKSLRESVSSFFSHRYATNSARHQVLDQLLKACHIALKNLDEPHRVSRNVPKESELRILWFALSCDSCDTAFSMESATTDTMIEPSFGSLCSTELMAERIQEGLNVLLNPKSASPGLLHFVDTMLAFMCVWTRFTDLPSAVQAAWNNVQARYNMTASAVRQLASAVEQVSAQYQRTRHNTHTAMPLASQCAVVFNIRGNSIVVDEHPDASVDFQYTIPVETFERERRVGLQAGLSTNWVEDRPEHLNNPLRGSLLMDAIEEHTERAEKEPVELADAVLYFSQRVLLKRTFDMWRTAHQLATRGKFEQMRQRQRATLRVWHVRARESAAQRLNDATRLVAAELFYKSKQLSYFLDRLRSIRRRHSLLIASDEARQSLTRYRKQEAVGKLALYARGGSRPTILTASVLKRFANVRAVHLLKDALTLWIEAYRQRRSEEASLHDKALRAEAAFFLQRARVCLSNWFARAAYKGAMKRAEAVAQQQLRHLCLQRSLRRWREWAVTKTRNNRMLREKTISIQTSRERSLLQDAFVTWRTNTHRNLHLKRIESLVVDRRVVKFLTRLRSAILVWAKLAQTKVVMDRALLVSERVHSRESARYCLRMWLARADMSTKAMADKAFRRQKMKLAVDKLRAFAVRSIQRKQDQAFAERVRRAADALRTRKLRLGYHALVQNALMQYGARMKALHRAFHQWRLALARRRANNSLKHGVLSEWAILTAAERFRRQHVSQIPARVKSGLKEIVAWVKLKVAREKLLGKILSQTTGRVLRSSVVRWKAQAQRLTISQVEQEMQERAICHDRARRVHQAIQQLLRTTREARTKREQLHRARQVVDNVRSRHAFARLREYAVKRKLLNAKAAQLAENMNKRIMKRSLRHWRICLVLTGWDPEESRRAPSALATSSTDDSLLAIRSWLGRDAPLPGVGAEGGTLTASNTPTTTRSPVLSSSGAGNEDLSLSTLSSSRLSDSVRDLMPKPLGSTKPKFSSAALRSELASSTNRANALGLVWSPVKVLQASRELFRNANELDEDDTSLASSSCFGEALKLARIEKDREKATGQAGSRSKSSNPLPPSRASTYAPPSAAPSKTAPMTAAKPHRRLDFDRARPKQTRVPTKDYRSAYDTVSTTSPAPGTGNLARLVPERTETDVDELGDEYPADLPLRAFLGDANPDVDVNANAAPPSPPHHPPDQGRAEKGEDEEDENRHAELDFDSESLTLRDLF